MINMTAWKNITGATLGFVLLVAAHSSIAATVPAGTALTIKTVGTISSSDRAGRTFPAELVSDVVVNGKVALKAGTPATLKVESSRATGSRSGPLSVNLANVSANGKSIAVKTSDAFHPRNKGKTARGRAAGVSSGSITLGPGTIMEFHLAQPLHL